MAIGDLGSQADMLRRIDDFIFGSGAASSSTASGGGYTAPISSGQPVYLQHIDDFIFGAGNSSSAYVFGGGATPAAAAPAAGSSTAAASATLPLARTSSLPTSTRGLSTLASSAISSTQLSAATGGNRTSAIPTSRDGNIDVTIGTGQSTYRQVVLSGGAAGTTYRVPSTIARSGVGVEVYAVTNYNNGAHTTQVLFPVNGELKVAPGDSVRLMVRVTGGTPGTHTVDLGFGKLVARVDSTVVKPVSMMTWVNPNDAAAHGGTTAGVETILQRFGVSSTGTTGAPASPNVQAMDRFYFSAAYEAANRMPVGEVAKRILEVEAKLQRTNPGATLWVQVSDEQDKTAAAAQQTVSWISQLRSVLAANGSDAKMFVAAQARPFNLSYASVVDGWATTQSSAGQTREQSLSQIRAASRQYGRPLEIMEYPGNAFFDGKTVSGAATSVASAGLDGVQSWFIFAANNQQTLERGVGDDGRGDIGGLVTVVNGRTYPTLALAEMEYGANLAGAAQALGSAALNSAGAQSVRTAGLQLDAYKTGAVPNFLLWETEMARLFLS